MPAKYKSRLFRKYVYSKTQCYNSSSNLIMLVGYILIWRQKYGCKKESWLQVRMRMTVSYFLIWRQNMVASESELDVDSQRQPILNIDGLFIWYKCKYLFKYGSDIINNLLVNRIIICEKICLQFLCFLNPFVLNFTILKLVRKYRDLTFSLNIIRLLYVHNLGLTKK